MTLYLVHFDSAEPDAARLEHSVDRFALKEGLWLIASDLDQSKLYHLIKRHLPHHAGLIVCEAGRPPKFKGMRAGALAWLRKRAG